VTPAVTRPLTLAECLQIALTHQPALAAAEASVAAAQAQRQALDDLHVPPILAAGRELPIRRHQADLGVTIAQAGLDVTRRETVYAVTRTYYSAVFARQQKKVADNVVSQFTDALDNGRRLLNAGARQVTKNDVEKTEAYLRLAEARRYEATRGAAVALAALREAMGVGPDYPLDVAATELPAPEFQVSRAEVLAQALARRGELVQATNAAEAIALEADAQETSCLPTHTTFAAYVDIHVRPIPQGASNHEYRPGAVGLEMPTMLVGKRSDRVERAHALSARAAAVVDKTRNLIALEVEDAFLKWQEAVQQAAKNRRAAELGEKLAVANLNDLKADQNVVFRDVLEAVLLGAQARLSYNEAVFHYVNALAALERATGGGFCAGFVR
jgi:outer membrane protein TolC